MEEITVFIFDNLEADITFYCAQGDYRHLHNIYVNGSSSKELVKEVVELDFNIITLDEFVAAIKNGAHLATIGWIP